MKYENSPAYHAVMRATTVRQLVTRRRYTKMAIHFHRSAGNLQEVEFFREDLKLIEERIKLLTREGKSV